MRQIELLIGLIFCFPVVVHGQAYRVGELTIDFFDSLRNRPVKTELWYPTMDTDSTKQRITELPFILKPTIRDAKFIGEKFPLVALSHGTGGNRFGLAWIAISLAEQGYIVAAPDHWGNTFDNKIPEYFVRYWERPLDIIFLVTRILNDKEISRYIDSGSIGMIGFSLGGYTSLALAGTEINCELLKNKAKTGEGKKEFTIPELGDLRKLIEGLSCDSIPKFGLKDIRIKAFIALAPALGLAIESPMQDQNITVPILIMGAENDQVVPVLTNARKYHELIASSQYVELQGEIGHYIFLNEADKNLQREAKIYYKDDKSINRGLIHKQVNDTILDFFEKNIRK